MMKVNEQSMTLDFGFEDPKISCFRKQHKTKVEGVTKTKMTLDFGLEDPKIYLV